MTPLHAELFVACDRPVPSGEELSTLCRRLLEGVATVDTRVEAAPAEARALEAALARALCATLQHLYRVAGNADGREEPWRRVLAADLLAGALHRVESDVPSAPAGLTIDTFWQGAGWARARLAPAGFTTRAALAQAQRKEQSRLAMGGADPVPIAPAWDPDAMYKSFPFHRTDRSDDTTRARAAEARAYMGSAGRDGTALQDHRSAVPASWRSGPAAVSLPPPGTPAEPCGRHAWMVSHSCGRTRRCAPHAGPSLERRPAPEARSQQPSRQLRCRSTAGSARRIGRRHHGDRTRPQPLRSSCDGRRSQRSSVRARCHPSRLRQRVAAAAPSSHIRTPLSTGRTRPRRATRYGVVIRVARSQQRQQGWQRQ